MPTWCTAGLRSEYWSVDARSRSRPHPQAELAELYDEEIQATGTAASLGAVWQPRPDVRSWLRYDRLFRFPATDELASYQNYPLAEPFNRGLEPEHGHSAELGASWQAGAWLLQAALFGQRLDSEIQYDPTTFLNTNLPGSDRWGAELSMQGQWHQLSLLLAWTQLEAEVREGTWQGYTPSLVPAEQGRIRLTWLPNEHLELSWALRYTGRQFEGNYLALIEYGLPNPNPYLPASTVSDFALRLKVGGRWNLGAVVDNVFDTDYATVKYQGGWYPATARTWRLQLSRLF